MAASSRLILGHSIRIMFSIADLHNFDDPEDFEGEEGEEENADKEPPTEFRVSVSITKVCLFFFFQKTRIPG